MKVNEVLFTDTSVLPGTVTVTVTSAVGSVASTTSYVPPAASPSFIANSVGVTFTNLVAGLVILTVTVVPTSGNFASS